MYRLCVVQLSDGEEAQEAEAQEAEAEYTWLTETEVQALINAGVPDDLIMEMDEAEVRMPDDLTIIPSLVNIIRQLDIGDIIIHFRGFCSLVQDEPYIRLRNPIHVLSPEQALKLLEHEGNYDSGSILRHWLTSNNEYDMVIGSFEEFLNCTDIGFDYDD